MSHAHYKQSEYLRKSRRLQAKDGPHKGKPAQFADPSEWDTNDKDTRELVLEDKNYLPTGTRFRIGIYDIEACDHDRDLTIVWEVIGKCLDPETRARAYKVMDSCMGYTAPERRLAKIAQFCQQLVPSEKQDWVRRYFNGEVMFADNPIPPFETE